LANPSKASKQAEFNRIQQQVSRIDNELDVVVEQYNESALNLQKTRRELQETTEQLQEAQYNMEVRQTAINKRFRFVYRQGSYSYLEILLNTKSLDQFLYYLELIQRQSEQDARIIAQYKASKIEIEKDSALLVAKEQKQEALLAQVATKKGTIASQLKQRNTLLSKVKGELAQYAKAEALRQACLQRSLKQRYGNMVARVIKVGSDPRHSTVSRGANRGVVSVAMNELGKPYVWGAEGPSSYDCSGLTRYVYGQLGVSLPHSSRAQYGCGQHVSMDQLQAGDLVFFSHGGSISHVGIYVGGGNFIHAPQTGDVVKVSNIANHGGYVGAVRP
jgi:cell wall-associated NlpC family hydrolase